MMNKNNTGLKILLVTVAVLLVIAIALVLVLMLGDRTPTFETIGVEFEAPVQIYATPEPTPEPEVTPEPTPEPTPEATPEPTPDADGFWPCEDTVTVDADSLNVRSGPGTDYSALGSVSRGTTLNRTGYSDSGWTRVVYEGTTAYVSSDYVTETE